MQSIVDEIQGNVILQHSLLAGLIGFLSQFIFRHREPTLPQFSYVVISVFIIALFGPVGAQIDNFYNLISLREVQYAFINTMIYLGTLSLSILYYRLLSTSHPLHQIPGPLLAKATQLYVLSRVINGQIRHDMTQIHKKYGDVVRIGPNEVSVSYPEAILQIHGSKSWIRGTAYNVSTHSAPGAPSEYASLLGLRDHETHTPRRRLWDRAFTMTNLKDYQPMVLNRLATLVEQFDKNCGQPLDLFQWMGYFVWDVTSGLAFGGGSDMLGDGADITGVMPSLTHSMHFQGQLMVLPWIAPLAAFIPMAQKTEAFRVFATRLFMTRFKEGSYSGDKDVFHYLLQEEAGVKPLTQSALAGDSSLVIAGGADTTRTVLTLLFLFILREPAQYKKLQKAIDEGVKGESMDSVGTELFPTHEALKNVPLLDCFINEILRINPPIPFEHVRDSPPEGANLAGFAIPGGVKVRVASNAVQRDPRNFKDPLVFKPERWLNTETELFNKSAFFPFLFGAFHCPGKQFAYQEMRIVIATLLYKYDAAFPEGFDSFAFETNLKDNGSLIEIMDPLPVIFTRRKK